MIILRLYARLLRLYPREFYARFGADMLGVFAQAWQECRHGRAAALVFCLHEFGGLLVSIAIEHASEIGRPGFRLLFRKRFVPLWLFVFSLMAAALFSLSYWGYLTVPSSTISAVQTIERVALVRFDENYTMSVIPLDHMPYLITPDFPPSQILSQLPANLNIDKTLDPTLAQELSAALARERVELAAPRAEYLPEPVMNPNSCGENCFQVGVQPQEDGSLVVIYPELNLEGQPPVDSMTQRVTPNDWWYYSFITPAGYVVQGKDADGTPLVFTAIASGAVGNDRYLYHELTFAPGADGLTLRNHMSYRFDISGLEGFNVAVTTTFLFLPLLFLWFLILFIGALIALVRQRTARWRAAT